MRDDQSCAKVEISWSDGCGGDRSVAMCEHRETVGGTYVLGHMGWALLGAVEGLQHALVDPLYELSVAVEWVDPKSGGNDEVADAAAALKNAAHAYRKAFRERVRFIVERSRQGRDEDSLTDSEQGE